MFACHRDCSERDHYSNPQSTETKSCAAQAQWVDLPDVPAPKAQGTLLERGQKDGKRQRIREFAVMSCLLDGQMRHW